MNKIDIAIKEMIKIREQDILENGDWEEGYGMSFLFNDGIGILSKDSNNIVVNIISGKPNIIDLNLEEQADE